MNPPNPPQAFDPLAPGYDADFTYTAVGRWLRARVQTRLLAHFQPGDHVLELGCGTGEDALALANMGVYVTATDVSRAMLAETARKTAHTGRVTPVPLDLRALPALAGQFDGVVSNFGALNVLDDWRPLAAWLAARVRPDGVLALGVMGRFCLWESLWHGLHGDLDTATRRWRGSSSFQPDANIPPIRIYYPTPRRLTSDFAPHFRRTYIGGLGVFLPPSDAYGVVEKRARLLRALTGLEAQVSGFPPFAWIADHFWMEFNKRG